MLLSLLRTRRFLPLLAGQTAGVLLDNLYKTAILLLILYVIPSGEESMNTWGIPSSMANTLPTALLVLPYLFFSSLAGDLCDKHSKSKMIVILKMIEMVLVIFGAYALYTENPYLMLACIFFLGIRATFLTPLRLAITPEYLKEKELIMGNAVFETAVFAGIFLGEILANVLFLSKTQGMLILIATLVITGLISLVSSLYLPETPAKNPELKINYNLLESSINIIQKTRHHRIVYLCILGISWFWLVASMVIFEIPHVLKNTINTTPGVVTFSLVVFGVGISFGSILCNRLLHSRIEATYVPLAAFGISFLLYDLASILHTLQTFENPIALGAFLYNWSHIHLVLNFFFIGTLGGLYHVPLYTIMQHESPEDMRARIMACHSIITTGFTILGALLNFLLSYFYHGNPAYTLAFISLMFAWLSLYISQIMPYDILTTILRWCFKFFYRARIDGLEHFQKASKDKLIIICNHTSWLDAIILAAFLPEQLTFAFNPNMTAHWLVRHFIKLNKVFMIDPTQPMSIRGLIEAIKDGEKVVIFPEGRITETGSLMKIYEFPAMIADSTHAKILPIHIQGMEQTFFSRSKGGRLFPLGAQMHIHIQPARYFPKPEKGDKRAKRKIASDFLYQIMTEMNYKNHKHNGSVFTGLLAAQRTHGRHKKVFEDINRNPMSYHQLLTKCFVLRLLYNQTLSPTKQIGVLLPPVIASVVNFYTLQAMGRVPVMLNYTHGPSQLLSCAQTSAIKEIITVSKLIEQAKLTSHIQMLEDAGYTIHYLDKLGPKITLRQKLTGAVTAWFARHYFKTIDPKVHTDDTAVVLFTSGSEGAPKGVALSHENIQANVSQVLSTTDLHTNDTIFNALPLYHSFGMIGALLLPVTSGIKVFLYPSPLHYRIINELIYDINATIIFSTDYFLALYAKHANAYDFYSLRYVVAGAEKLQASTAKLWSEKFGIRILGGYGLTEASPAVSINSPMHHVSGSVGRFLPKIQYRLEPIEDIHEGGLLWIKGPNIMQGYILHDKPGVIQPPKDGWHNTGDICSVDENGFLFILDRAKRFAKIAGEMVSLTAVENLIDQAFPGSAHAVLSVPSAKRGEEIVLCTENASLSRQEVQKYFQEKGISELWIPKSLIVITIPRFLTGKTNYTDLKQALNAIENPPENSAKNPDEEEA